MVRDRGEATMVEACAGAPMGAYEWPWRKGKGMGKKKRERKREKEEERVIGV